MIDNQIINILKKEGISPNDENTLKSLVDKIDAKDIDSPVDNNGNTLLMLAANKGMLSIVQMLHDKGADINKTNSKGQTALNIAKLKSQNNVIQYLSPLVHTPKTFSTDLIKNLFKSLNDKDYTEKEFIAEIDKIPEEQLNTISSGKTLLMILSEKGWNKAVKQLIEKGIKIDIINDSNGNSALLYAAKNGNNDVVNTLIEAGADINRKNTKGNTALALTIITNNPSNVEQRKEIIKTLTDKYSNKQSLLRELTAINQMIKAGSYTVNSDISKYVNELMSEISTPKKEEEKQPDELEIFLGKQKFFSRVAEYIKRYKYISPELFDVLNTFIPIKDEEKQIIVNKDAKKEAEGTFFILDDRNPPEPFITYDIDSRGYSVDKKFLTKNQQTALIKWLKAMKYIVIEDDEREFKLAD